jgi:hypothetical protein
VETRFEKLEIVDDKIAEILRRKTQTERIAMVDQFWWFARDLIHAMVSREHLDWPEDEIRRQVSRRMSNGAD